MKFTAAIDIMPLKEILDPQGKAVLLGLKNLEIDAVSACRIGRHITMEIEANSKNEANEVVDQACKSLLANLIMETYTFELNEV